MALPADAINRPDITDDESEAEVRNNNNNNANPPPPRRNNNNNNNNNNNAASISAMMRLPTFWKANPKVWFVRVEAAFNNQGITRDTARFDYVVSALDDNTVQEIADVLLNPPDTGKYDFLKTQILARLTDTTEQQLHKLFTQLELGDQKPSQLLRRMKSLAGSAISEEAIRVKWFDLLPPSVSRSLKVVKSSPIDELASLADELMPDSTALNTTSVNVTSSKAPTIESLADELASLRLSMAQLISLTRQQNSATKQPSNQQQKRGRSRSKSQNRQRKDSPSNADNELCWYHRTFGKDAQNCKKPCSFSSNQGNH